MMRLCAFYLVVAVAVAGCTILPGRNCSAPVLHPKSIPAELGVKYAPTCQGFVLDFDTRFWFATSNEDAAKLCKPGDTVTLIDTDHVRYVRSDGTLIALGSPTREHHLGCA
jgi:hypothetical protein